MNRNFVKFVMRIYAYFRRLRNPLVLPKDSIFNIIFRYSIYQFSDYINQYGYKFDPLHGLYDYTASPEHFIDPNTSEGRDCDDWARMWSLWGIHNGYIAYEYIINMPNKPFSTAHVITVLERNDKYMLCNYYPYGPYESINEAIESIPSRSQIYTKDFIYVRSDKFNKVSAEVHYDL